jgi:hypothetical protein
MNRKNEHNIQKVKNESNCHCEEIPNTTGWGQQSSRIPDFELGLTTSEKEHPTAATRVQVFKISDEEIQTKTKFA